MAQAICYWTVSVEARVRFQAVHEKFVVDKVVLGESFLRILPLSSCQHHNTHVP